MDPERRILFLASFLCLVPIIQAKLISNPKKSSPPNSENNDYDVEEISGHPVDMLIFVPEKIYISDKMSEEFRQNSL